MVASQDPGISSAIVPAKIGCQTWISVCIIDAAICLGYLPSFNPAARSTPTKLCRDSPALSSALPASSLYNLRQEAKDAPRISHIPFNSHTALRLSRPLPSARHAMASPLRRTTYSPALGCSTLPVPLPLLLFLPSLGSLLLFGRWRCRHPTLSARNCGPAPHPPVSLSLATSSSSSSSPLLLAIFTVVAKKSIPHSAVADC
ncbi:hypothetical protein HDK77DRAFT_4195 [Phyllosticta capitalensis]